MLAVLMALACLKGCAGRDPKYEDAAQAISQRAAAVGLPNKWQVMMHHSMLSRLDGRANVDARAGPS